MLGAMANDLAKPLKALKRITPGQNIFYCNLAVDPIQ
jgi:hypothetical protein